MSVRLLAGEHSRMLAVRTVRAGGTSRRRAGSRRRRSRYFCGSRGSRKIRNVERDTRCAFGVAIHGYDVALEGRAARVTDDAQLQRLAQVFAEGGSSARPRTLVEPPRREASALADRVGRGELTAAAP